MSEPLYDLIYDIQHHGFSILTIAGIIIWLLKERRDSALFHNQKIIMERLEVGKRWSNGQLNGWKPTLRPLSKRRFFLSHQAIPQASPLKRRTTNMKSQNINYATLIPTILGAAKLILQTFGIEIPDTVVNEIVNGAAAVGTVIGIFMAHRKQVLVPAEPNKFTTPTL